MQKQCFLASRLNNILKCNTASGILSKDILAELDIYPPKVKRSEATKIFRQDAENCKTILLYVIGGGSYYEYQNIQEAFKVTFHYSYIYSNKGRNINVIYGATSIYNSNQFLEQVFFT